MPSTLAARITKSFGRGETRQVVLDDLALELSAPDLVVILGESGCGKTTLLNILGGTLPRCRHRRRARRRCERWSAAG
mgnify:CR=1 FL=1